MTLNLDCQNVTLTNLISQYEEHYFLGYTSKIIRSPYQSSLFVENKIEKILQQGLTPDDLTLIIAWKLGCIDHPRSTNSIVYLNNCNETLTFKTPYSTINLSDYFTYIKANWSYISKLANETPRLAFDELYNNRPKYFGPTYVITLLFFLTKGTLPIYDKFAYFALLAIKNNIQPSSTKQKIVEYKEISHGNSGWNTYMTYRELLLNFAGDEGYRIRPVDRTLWVYGHLFTDKKCKHCT